MDRANLRSEQLVRVRAFGGKQLVRRVVFARGDVVAVCCEEEYVKATEQRRKPGCIGFNVDAILAASPPKPPTR